MLLRFALEYSDVLHAYVLPRLRGMDILALSRACSQMQPLRLHPAAIHARALAPSLRAIRVPYHIRQCRYYAATPSSYEIVCGHMVSTRGTLECHYVHHDDYDYTVFKRFYSDASVVRIDIDTRLANNVKAVIHRYGQYELGPNDLFDAWRVRNVRFTLMISYMFVWNRIYLDRDDMTALACTCETMCARVRKWGRAHESV